MITLPEPTAEPAGAAAAADPFFEDDFVEQHDSDPLEPMNRPIFAGNMALDRFFIDPVAHAYGVITPASREARRAQRLREPECAGGAGERGVAVEGEAGRTDLRTLRTQLDARHRRHLRPRRGTRLERAPRGLRPDARPATASAPASIWSSRCSARARRATPWAPPSTCSCASTRWLLPLQGQLFLGGGFGISERDNRREELRALREGRSTSTPPCAAPTCRRAKRGCARHATPRHRVARSGALARRCWRTPAPQSSSRARPAARRCRPS